MCGSACRACIVPPIYRPETVIFATIAFPEGVSAAVVRERQAVAVPGYADVGQLFRAGAAAMGAVRAAMNNERWMSFRDEDLRLPVPSPGAVICVGLNYRAHIEEMGRELPQHPTYFAKLSRALTEPFAAIQLPQMSDKVDYEAELVIVIGRGGRDIETSRAHEHIGGYTLMNDITLRDWQYRSVQWFAGKNLERSTPVGPYVVTPDQFTPDGAVIELSVNGELRQRAPLSDLVFDASRLVVDVSRILTLEPGDLIATGTPGGVGHSMQPPAYIQDGDLVEVHVEGLGSIANEFRKSA